eukprot:m.11235 g.11235  ORF g.11235 m.11235 type:complete len:283 (-) comp4404_c0_seq2:1350-2198(-)
MCCLINLYSYVYLNPPKFLYAAFVDNLINEQDETKDKLIKQAQRQVGTDIKALKREIASLRTKLAHVGREKDKQVEESLEKANTDKSTIDSLNQTLSQNMGELLKAKQECLQQECELVDVRKKLIQKDTEIERLTTMVKKTQNQLQLLHLGKQVKRQKLDNTPKDAFEVGSISSVVSGYFSGVPNTPPWESAHINLTPEMPPSTTATNTIQDEWQTLAAEQQAQLSQLQHEFHIQWCMISEEQAKLLQEIRQQHMQQQLCLSQRQEERCPKVTPSTPSASSP